MCGGLEQLLPTNPSLLLVEGHRRITVGEVLHRLFPGTNLTGSGVHSEILEGNCLRPGIILLINGVDSVVYSDFTIDILVSVQDTLTFISTLHGG